MEEVKKWSVTYTKHVKQKRKVYQDGFLELRASTNKVVLYDDCEKVLESRFVKKDDVIQSGEAIAFASHLVDINCLIGDHKPIPDVNYQRNNKKIDEKSATFGTQRNKKLFSSPVILGKRKTEAPSSSLCPSQKIVREFKNKEMIKHSISPSLPDTSKPPDGWQVLYTTHVTQKAKKYHDGFLQLVPCGSQGRQIMLYDETERLLSSRFLKKHEVINSGGSLTFDGYLVDIGECAAASKPVTVRDYNIVEKTGMLQNQSHNLIESSVASEILNFIKKPVISINEAAIESSSSKASHAEGFSLIHSEENFLKEELVQDSQSQLDYAMCCPSGEVINIADNVYDLKVISQSKGPGSSNLSGATVTSSLRSREKCDSSNWKQTSLVKELQGVRATKVDSASNVSCKEKQTGKLPAAELCLKSSRPPKDVKVENIEWADFGEIKARRDEYSGADLPVHISGNLQSAAPEKDFSLWKMDDAPSFDLGF